MFKLNRKIKNRKEGGYETFYVDLKLFPGKIYKKKNSFILNSWTTAIGVISIRSFCFVWVSIKNEKKVEIWILII